MEKLLSAALAVQKNAYCPYSKYQVGCALFGVDGQIYVGCNVENISFGLTICAERNALAAMNAAGCRKFTEAVVVTRDGGTPCGACRQCLLEFAEDMNTVKIVCASEAGEKIVYTLVELIPNGFTSDL